VRGVNGCTVWTVAGEKAIFLIMQFTVTVCHDEREGVWYVQSSDVPGLNAEATTLEALIQVVADLAPELVAVNLPEAGFDDRATIPLRVEHIVNAKRAPAA
jgi:predicted RNase H-like HicB family nuclease